MYVATIVKNPKPITKTLGCDSPHNPKKCLMKCITDSNIIYQIDGLKDLFVSLQLSLELPFSHYVGQ